MVTECNLHKVVAGTPCQVMRSEEILFRFQAKQLSAKAPDEGNRFDQQLGSFHVSDLRRKLLRPKQVEHCEHSSLIWRFLVDSWSICGCIPLYSIVFIPYPESPESLTASWPLMTVAARTTENKDCPLGLSFAVSILLTEVEIPHWQNMIESQWAGNRKAFCQSAAITVLWTFCKQRWGLQSADKKNDAMILISGQVLAKAAWHRTVLTFWWNQLDQHFIKIIGECPSNYWNVTECLSLSLSPFFRSIGPTFFVTFQ